MAGDQKPPKPTSLHEARKSFHRWLTELMGTPERADEVMEEAKTDQLPDPYETLDAYTKEELDSLWAIGQIGTGDRKKWHARQEELRIDEANEKE